MKLPIILFIGLLAHSVAWSAVGDSCVIGGWDSTIERQGNRLVCVPPEQSSKQQYRDQAAQILATAQDSGGGGKTTTSICPAGQIACRPDVYLGPSGNSQVFCARIQNFLSQSCNTQRLQEYRSHGDVNPDVVQKAWNQRFPNRPLDQAALNRLLASLTPETRAEQGQSLQAVSPARDEDRQRAAAMRNLTPQARRQERLPGPGPNREQISSGGGGEQSAGCTPSANAQRRINDATSSDGCVEEFVNFARSRGGVCDVQLLDHQSAHNNNTASLRVDSDLCPPGYSIHVKTQSNVAKPRQGAEGGSWWQRNFTNNLSGRDAGCYFTVSGMGEWRGFEGHVEKLQSTLTSDELKKYCDRTGNFRIPGGTPRPAPQPQYQQGGR